MGFMVISIGGGHDYGDLVVMGMVGIMVISIGGDHDYGDLVVMGMMGIVVIREWWGLWG